MIRQDTKKKSTGVATCTAADRGEETSRFKHPFCGRFQCFGVTSLPSLRQGGGAGNSGGRSPAKTTAMMATPLPDTPSAPPKEEQPALVYGESAKRSFVKALAWRLTAGVVTLVRP